MGENVAMGRSRSLLGADQSSSTKCYSIQRGEAKSSENGQSSAKLKEGEQEKAEITTVEDNLRHGVAGGGSAGWHLRTTLSEVLERLILQNHPGCKP